MNTPEETIRNALVSLNATLAQDILDRIRSAPAAFFERVIVALVLAMGYGGSSAEAGRAIGKSGPELECHVPLAWGRDDDRSVAFQRAAANETRDAATQIAGRQTN